MKKIFKRLRYFFSTKKPVQDQYQVILLEVLPGAIKVYKEAIVTLKYWGEIGVSGENLYDYLHSKSINQGICFHIYKVYSIALSHSVYLLSKDLLPEGYHKTRYVNDESTHWITPLHKGFDRLAIRVDKYEIEYTISLLQFRVDMMQKMLKTYKPIIRNHEKANKLITRFGKFLTRSGRGIPKSFR